jgi:nitrite reductase/ring-hydroxylating ferredoxin subunit
MHDHDVLMDQAREMLALHQEGTTFLVDDVYEEPVSVYLDEGRAEAERESLFLRTPQVVCLSNQLVEAGSQVAVTVADLPVIVVRGDDGSIRGFVNACRHRGSTVVTEDTCSRRMTCPYHGWSYDLEGSLVGVPGSAGFHGMDRDAHALASLRVEERHGISESRSIRTGHRSMITWARWGLNSITSGSTTSITSRPERSGRGAIGSSRWTPTPRAITSRCCTRTRSVRSRWAI